MTSSEFMGNLVSPSNMNKTPLDMPKKRADPAKILSRCVCVCFCISGRVFVLSPRVRDLMRQF